MPGFNEYGVNIDLQRPQQAPFDIFGERSGGVRMTKNLRILVIEDDALIGMLFSDTLAGMGHSVCGIVANEADAITAAREHQPDLMIVDARLGRDSGLSAVDQIVASSFIPHVFVTGDKRGVVAQRPDAVIVEKPFHVAELAAAITRAMTG